MQTYYTVLQMIPGPHLNPDYVFPRMYLSPKHFYVQILEIMKHLWLIIIIIIIIIRDL